MNNLTEQDIRAIVRDELRNIVGASQPTDIEYLPTSKAYLKLGYDSPQQLRNKVKDGLFRVSNNNKNYEVQDRRKKDSLMYFFES